MLVNSTELINALRSDLIRSFTNLFLYGLFPSLGERPSFHQVQSYKNQIFNDIVANNLMSTHVNKTKAAAFRGNG